jgi:hypothetical protein
VDDSVTKRRFRRQTNANLQKRLQPRAKAFTPIADMLRRGQRIMSCVSLFDRSHLRVNIHRGFAWPPIADRLALCKTPACYSGDGCAALNFRPDDQVKHPNAVKINFVIFDLNDRFRRAEIPLLLDQGTQRVSLIR